ncbi:MAG: LPS assembly protein LptD, partial [Halioglobus sp.]|nr:LPS assembly protein LptD [Halioglobus sp.]
AQLDYLGNNWLMTLQAQQFQSLADDINNDYKKLPQFSARYRGTSTPFQVEPVAFAQYSSFDDDDDRVTGQRLYGEAGVTYPMQWAYGFLDSTVKYRYLAYELSDLTTTTDDNPTAGSALASVDGGLFFERFTDLGGRNMLQTLEPRLYYLYSEHEQQDQQPDFDSAELTFTYNQLFRETRFSGRDRLDDANQLALGLTTRFIDNDDGRNLFSASIGEIFYFRDRKVRLNPGADAIDDSTSELAGELAFSPTDEVTVRASLIYDHQEDRANSGYFRAGYESPRGGIFNLGYSYRRPLTSVALNQRTTEEASISTFLPLNNSWSVFAAMNYSLETDESVEDMIGVEYDSCCWTVRLLHLRYFNNVSGTVVNLNDPDLERENTTQFQIILKGMGGFGDRITDIMEDMIRGFDERDY